jgi:hypothetical protein
LSFQYSYFKLSHSKYINEERYYNSFSEQLRFHYQIRARDARARVNR